MTDINSRIDAVVRADESKRALERGIAADATYVREKTNGDRNVLKFGRIIQLCDNLRTYEVRAEQFKKASKRLSEFNGFIARTSEDAAGTNPDFTRVLKRTQDLLPTISSDLADARAAIDNDQKWLSELIDWLVLFRLRDMLSICVEIWKNNKSPHELQSFDWQKFADELLCVRDEAERRKLAADSSSEAENPDPNEFKKDAPSEESNGGNEPLEAAYIFRPDGNGYYVKFGDESGHFSTKGATGLRDLFRLVQSPGVNVPMLELEAGPGVKQAEGDGRSPQLVTDQEGIKAIKAQGNQLLEDIKNAESEIEREELQNQFDSLNTHLGKLLGKNGKPRDINKTDLNRMKSNISGRISTFCKNIEKEYPNLANHFRNATGAIDVAFFVYTPGIHDMKWDTTAKAVGCDPTKPVKW